MRRENKYSKLEYSLIIPSRPIHRHQEERGTKEVSCSMDCADNFLDTRYSHCTFSHINHIFLQCDVLFSIPEQLPFLPRHTSGRPFHPNKLPRHKPENAKTGSYLVLAFRNPKKGHITSYNHAKFRHQFCHRKIVRTICRQISFLSST